jgi:hypothetical protein
MQVTTTGVFSGRRAAMDIKNKLREILEGVDFRCSDPVESSDQLLKLGEHVLAQYEALGEERQQRAFDLFGIILAEILQPQALARYGDTSFNSVRQVLVEEFPQLESSPEWEKYIKLAKQAIANLGLTGFQAEQLNRLFDLMPYIVVEFIADLASRFDLLPRENAAILSLVLRDMCQEEANHAEFK